MAADPILNVAPHIMGFLPPTLMARSTCRTFHDILEHGPAPRKHQTVAADALAVLQWLRQVGSAWNELVPTIAAAGGHLAMLQWAHANGCPWDSDTCMYAAANGHLAWARANGCPWDEDTCSRAAEGGNLDILLWARANGAPWDEETCASAGRGGHLEVLQWARANWCPWDEHTIESAKDEGHQEQLEECAAAALSLVDMTPLSRLLLGLSAVSEGRDGSVHVPAELDSQRRPASPMDSEVKLCYVASDSECDSSSESEPEPTHVRAQHLSPVCAPHCERRRRVLIVLDLFGPKGALVKAVHAVPRPLTLGASGLMLTKLVASGSPAAPPTSTGRDRAQAPPPPPPPPPLPQLWRSRRAPPCTTFSSAAAISPQLPDPSAFNAADPAGGSADSSAHPLPRSDGDVLALVKGEDEDGVVSL
ncbi:hypothetical protein JKP88DRAFT_286895 [Tribonema minus]|uniref:Uncharacterized protein n=1 Tax=Tribonema minus TaxID=303371 RepID=A0A836CL03_9STRA|nr:hypothetical protein JKP88DRAFT_286895 [Tribonema minus]